MNPDIFSALIGGASGIICAIITARMTNNANRKRAEQTKTVNAAYLTSQIAPALRDYAAMCFAVSHDDGYAEGRPAGKNGMAQATVTPTAFKPSDFTVDWQSLPSDLMVEILTFQEHARIEASALDDEYGYHDPPDFEEFFLDRQHVYTRLGIKALRLAERLYDHTKLNPHEHGKDLRGQLATRLTDLTTQRDARAQRMAQYRLSPDEL